MRVAVIAHIYYRDLIKEFVFYFKKLPIDTDIYISTSPESKANVENEVLKIFAARKVHVRVVENRGMDIAPFLMFFKEIHLSYDLICKVHTKKGNHLGFNEGWRTYLLENLLGSEEIVGQIIEDFQRDKKLGVIFPEYFPFTINQINWGDNFDRASVIAANLGIEITRECEIHFPAASMFWFRPEALALLNNLNWQYADFEGGSEYASDGMLANAVERIFLFIATKSDFYWKKVLFQPLLKKSYRVSAYSELLSEHLNLTNTNVSKLFRILEENESTNQSTTAQLQSTTAQLQSTTAQLQSTTAELQVVQAELTMIKETLGWTFIKNIYRYMDEVFPYDSRRWRYLQVFKNFLKGCR